MFRHANLRDVTYIFLFLSMRIVTYNTDNLSTETYILQYMFRHVSTVIEIVNLSENNIARFETS